MSIKFRKLRKTEMKGVIETEKKEKVSKAKIKKKEQKMEIVEKRRNWKIFSLIAAELAFFLGLTSYSSTQIAKVLSPAFLLPISVIPALMLFTDKNPFSFEFFGIILFLEFPKFIPSTPIFKSIMNSLYYFGLQNLARYLYSILNPQPCPSLPLIVVLFCFARMIENMRINYIGIALLTSVFVYLLYPGVMLYLQFNTKSLMFAILAMGIAAVAYYLVKRS